MVRFEINHWMVIRQGTIASHCNFHRKKVKRGLQEKWVENKEKVVESTCFNHLAIYLSCRILINTWDSKFHDRFVFTRVHRIDDLNRTCIHLLPTGEAIKRVPSCTLLRSKTAIDILFAYWNNSSRIRYCYQGNLYSIL